MFTETNRAPDINMLSDMVDAQSPELRELFQYALGILLVEKGEAEIAEQHRIDERTWLIMRTASGDLFSAVKPEGNDRRLATMRAIAAECLEEC